MIHVTITDLETNEVKLDKDVNAVVVGAADDDHVGAAVIGKQLKDVAHAYILVEDAIIHKVAQDNPEFWPIYDFLKAMQAIKEDDDDADE